MTQEEFIALVRRDALASAAPGQALRPTGRRPHQVLVTLWNWYTALPENEQALVGRAMQISAYGALFGIFAMLDGVRAIDHPPHGELKLTYITPDGHEHPLNGVPLGLDELHGLWSSEAFPYTEPLTE